jgi:hypothetical protein
MLSVGCAMNRRQKETLRLLTWACVVISSLSGLGGCAKQQPAPGAGNTTVGHPGTSATPAQEEGAMHDTAVTSAGHLVIEDSQMANDVASVAAEIGNGSVEYAAGDLAPGEVQVEWRIEQAHGPGVKAKPEDLRITLVREGGVLRVKDEYTGPKTARRPELSLWITLHKDIPVDCDLGNGRVKLEAPLINKVALGNGDVETMGALTPQGGIAIGNGALRGKLLVQQGEHDLSVGNGRIELALQNGSSCALSASVSMGRIETSGINEQRHWGMTGGSVEGAVGTGAAKLELNVGNGQISVSVQ